MKAITDSNEIPAEKLPELLEALKIVVKDDIEHFKGFTLLKGVDKDTLSYSLITITD